MNNIRIQQFVFEQLMNRIDKYLLKAALLLPALKGTKYTGVMNFWFTRSIFFDRDFLPLTSGVH